MILNLSDVSFQLLMYYNLSKYQFQMECSSCYLRYNSSFRKPMILLCGHSLCSTCQPNLAKCPICSFCLNSQKINLNYSLLELLEKDKKNIDKFVKVCFIGGSGFGKTSLIRALTGEQFMQEVTTTIGYDFTFKDREIDDYNVRYQLWDSAGQERYQAISPIHYKNADIIIIVYDLAKDSSTNKVSYWLDEAEKYCGQKTAKLLIGNKIDILDCHTYMPFEERVEQMIKEERINHIEISCKKDIGIDKIWERLQILFFEVRKKQHLNPDKNKNNLKEQVKVTKKKGKKKKAVKQAQYSCC